MFGKYIAIDTYNSDLSMFNKDDAINLIYEIQQKTSGQILFSVPPSHFRRNYYPDQFDMQKFLDEIESNVISKYEMNKELLFTLDKHAATAYPFSEYTFYYANDFDTIFKFAHMDFMDFWAILMEGSEITYGFYYEEGYIDMVLKINCSPNPSFDIKDYLDNFAKITGRDIPNYYEELMKDGAEFKIC